MLVNEYEAHRNGGKFIVRFDDNQELWSVRQTAKEQQDIIDEMVDDIEWLGIGADSFTRNSFLEESVAEVINSLNKDIKIPEGTIVKYNSPNMVGSNIVMYPYYPLLTVEKVVMDFIQEISLLIRGEDLVTEFSLYKYYCEMLRIDSPLHVYLPRMRLNGENRDLSKHNRFGTIKEARGLGLKPQNLIDMVRIACLIDPGEAFSIENIKERPIL
jgi:glutamyl/glutaminyl-tRNA synthetase